MAGDRRGSGRGSSKKRASGISKRVLADGSIKWDVSCYTTLKDGSRKHIRKTFESYYAARDGQAQILVAIKAGAYEPARPSEEPQEMHVAALMAEYLAAKKREVTPKTLYDYEFTVVRYVLGVVPPVGTRGYTPSTERISLPTLRDRLLTEVTRSTIQEHLDTISTRHIGPTTVRRVRMHLNAAFDLALQMGYVEKNPVSTTAQPRLPRRPPLNVWTREQATTFLEAATSSRWGPIWSFAIFTGCRRGELLGLKWADINFETRLIVIQRAVIALKGKAAWSRTKSQAGERTIKATKKTIALLAEHKARQDDQRTHLGAAWIDHDLVFCQENGAPINPDLLRHDYNRCIARAGVRRVRVHDLRHTFVSMSLDAGVPLKLLSEMVGHQDISTTLGTYTHLLQEKRAQGVDALDDLL